MYHCQYKKSQLLKKRFCEKYGTSQIAFLSYSLIDIAKLDRKDVGS